MKILGVDQSLSKCAMVLLEDGIPTNLRLSKTGASKVKTKRKDTVYYDTLQEQIHHICEDLTKEVKKHNPDVIVFEALSYGSMGDATRNLACLYGAMRERLVCLDWEGVVLETAPTSLKSYGHTLLPEGLKWSGVTTAGKPKKVKMDKKLMVEAVRNRFGKEYLRDYNYSTGLDDLADATLLADKYWSENAETQ